MWRRIFAKLSHVIFLKIDMLPESDSAPLSPVPFLRRKWLPALSLFVISALLLFFAALQYYWPGKWWSSAEALGWDGEALVLVKGQGQSGQGRLTIDGLAESGVALASLSPPAFQAEDYAAVKLLVSGKKAGSRAEFLWQTEESRGRIFTRPLEWNGNAVAPLIMEGDPNWRGQVTGIALLVRAPLDASLVVEAVRLEPFAPLVAVWREWFGAAPWVGTSINFVGGDADRRWLAPLPFAAAALGLALLGYGALVRAKLVAPDIGMLWVLVFLAWFALDLRWQIDLWQKLGLTQQSYAGKSWEEKHLAAVDGRLFDLMRQVRAKLPPNPDRVFLFADEEYVRGRGAYHLYPFNVMNGRDLLPAGQFRSGDFIVILGKDEVGYDPARSLLTWAPQQKLSADLLLLAENNVLLKVR